MTSALERPGEGWRAAGRPQQHRQLPTLPQQTPLPMLRPHPCITARPAQPCSPFTIHSVPKRSLAVFATPPSTSSPTIAPPTTPTEAITEHILEPRNASIMAPNQRLPTTPPIVEPQNASSVVSSLLEPALQLNMAGTQTAAVQQEALLPLSQATNTTTAGQQGAPQPPPASHQQRPTTRVVVVGVDPDSHGAVAVVSWDTHDLSDTLDVKNMQGQLEVYDMPCAEVVLQKKNKATGKQVKRRWLDMTAARELVVTILNKHAPGLTPGGGWPQHTNNGNGRPTHASLASGVSGGTNGNGHPASGGGGSNGNGHLATGGGGPNGNGRTPHSEGASNASGGSSAHGGAPGLNGTGGVAPPMTSEGVTPPPMAGGVTAPMAGGATPPPVTAEGVTQPPMYVELRAYLETTPTMPFNCSPRTLAPQLHSVGGWHGLLAMAGFKACTVPASVWKRDLALVGLDKTGSVALAHQLWPDLAGLLARKKDHGRAEAMLIVAWALGAARSAPAGSPPTPRASRSKREAQAPALSSASQQQQQAAGRGSQVQAALNAQPPAGQAAAALRTLMLARAGIPARAADVVATASNGNGAAGSGDVGAPAGPAAAAAGTAGAVQSAAIVVGPNGAQPDQLQGQAEDAVPGANVATTAAAAAAPAGSAGEGDETGLQKRPLTAEEREALREQMAALVKERSAWPVRLGSLRMAVPTDGYGNPLPTASTPVVAATPTPLRRAATKQPAAGEASGTKRGRLRSGKESAPSEEASPAAELEAGMPAAKLAVSPARRGVRAAKPAAPPAEARVGGTPEAKRPTSPAGSRVGTPAAQRAASPLPGRAGTPAALHRSVSPALPTLQQQRPHHTDATTQQQQQADAIIMQQVQQHHAIGAGQGSPSPSTEQQDQETDGIPNVSWREHPPKYRWRGSLNPGGPRSEKCFSVAKYGTREAARAAAAQFSAEHLQGAPHQSPPRDSQDRQSPEEAWQPDAPAPKQSDLVARISFSQRRQAYIWNGYVASDRDRTRRGKSFSIAAYKTKEAAEAAAYQYSEEHPEYVLRASSEASGSQERERSAAGAAAAQSGEEHAQGTPLPSSEALDAPQEQEGSTSAVTDSSARALPALDDQSDTNQQPQGSQQAFAVATLAEPAGDAPAHQA